jgi:hypothetical protein
MPFRLHEELNLPSRQSVGNSAHWQNPYRPLRGPRQPSSALLRIFLRKTSGLTRARGAIRMNGI